MQTQSPHNSRKLISIVVPMCNEEESLEILREKLDRLQSRLAPSFGVEYCLVDDGSTDKTWELMQSAVPTGASCVCSRHETNRGLGAALRTGMQASSGDIVCTIDADCSYSPVDLLALIEQIDTGTADVAVASPYHPLGGVNGVKPWRIILSRGCSSLYRWTSSVKLYTYTSIFRAYDGTLARQLQFKRDGFVSAVEMLIFADRLGYRICEMPLVLNARLRGYSKIRIARTIWTHVGMLMSVCAGRLTPAHHKKRGFAVHMQGAAESVAARTVQPSLSKDTSIG